MFTVKAVDVGSHNTRNCQIVNHFGRSSTFTTKVNALQIMNVTIKNKVALAAKMCHVI